MVLGFLFFHSQYKLTLQRSEQTLHSHKLIVKLFIWCLEIFHLTSEQVTHRTNRLILYYIIFDETVMHLVQNLTEFIDPNSDFIFNIRYSDDVAANFTNFIFKIVC